MKNYLLAVIGLFTLALAGCNTPGCLVQDKIADVGANFTNSALECDDVAGIKQELNDSVLSHSGLCKAAEEGADQGVLANTFCPTLSQTLVDFVKAQGQPFLDRHKCKAVNATNYSVQTLTALCERLPVSTH